MPCPIWSTTYPQAPQIRVVLANLSTHSAAALYESFRAPEAAPSSIDWSSTFVRKIRQLAQHGRDRDRRVPSPIRTTDDTIDLLRRLSAHYPDTVIAGILNRQERKTATGLSFTANRVASLRAHWHVPCFEPNNTNTRR
jgi:hypothetical protein